MEFEKITDDIFVLYNFLTPERCQELIDFSEAQRYEAAPVHIGRKEVMMTTVRNSGRVVHDSFELVEEMWEKLQYFVIQETEYGVASGLNERFRFYRYEVGQEFKPHKDGSFIRNIHEWSSYTFLVYLNDVEEGGATICDGHTIKAERGKALVFAHNLTHAGAVITKGVKYVIRTDVMYKRKGK